MNIKHCRQKHVELDWYNHSGVFVAFAYFVTSLLALSSCVLVKLPLLCLIFFFSELQWFDSFIHPCITKCHGSLLGSFQVVWHV